MKRLAVAAVAVALAAQGAWGACCYFAAKDKDILQPGQKAFITWEPKERIETFTVQPKFEGNAVDFGMVIPTPSRPKLDEMPRDFFKDLAIYSILLPLPQPIAIDLVNWEKFRRYEADERSDAPQSAAGVPKPTSAPPPVVVLEAGVVGSLDYKIIVASDASGLFQWLKDNAYSYSGDEKTLEFYIAKKWYFTVMKIDPKAMKKNPDGTYTGEVTPTRFTFESEKCIYPLKITQISVKDKTDALFYVQAPEQMDLEGDLSWQHSFRVMWLTFMLGCGATPEQQQELQTRNQWVEAKRSRDPGFETTKLEWARKLGDAEMSVLERPLDHYAQGGGADVGPGGKEIPLKRLLEIAWERYEKNTGKDERDDAYAKTRLAQIETAHPASKGRIVHFEGKAPAWPLSEFTFYPNREAPAEDVKGLTRLKGHLQKGRWLTKFRKHIRKDEMSDDLVLVPVTGGRECEYVRILPTSPP